MDASFGARTRGYEFVLRDQYGHVMIFGAGPLVSVTSIEHAEALAMWLSVQAVRKFWHQPMVVTTYCKNLAQQLMTKRLNLLSLGNIVVDLLSLLKQLPTFGISYNHRNNNCVVHRLARICSSITQYVVWLFSSHPTIMNVLHYWQANTWGSFDFVFWKKIILSCHLKLFFFLKLLIGAYFMRLSYFTWLTLFGIITWTFLSHQVFLNPPFFDLLLRTYLCSLVILLNLLRVFIRSLFYVNILLELFLGWE